MKKLIVALIAIIAVITISINRDRDFPPRLTEESLEELLSNRWRHIESGKTTESYLFFWDEEDRLYGFDGSSHFGGYYTIFESEIKFSPIKAPSPVAFMDNNFIKDLRSTNMFHIYGDTLQLYTQKGPSLKFIKETPIN